MEPQLIQNRIYLIRGERVMLDFDLAALYEVETKALNQAIKRNIDSFPDDFMFRLTENEWQAMSSQFVMTSTRKRTKSALPYAFTEHGVTMLSSVLKSPKARQMNIAIVRAFITLRKFALQNNEVLSYLKQLKNRIDEHDIQLSSIYDAIENLLDEKVAQKSWEEREPIGFKQLANSK